jgi:hypothetical protein
MSVSLSFRDPEPPWLSADVSVGSCRSSCERNVSLKRFAMDNVSFNQGALHHSKTHRMPSHDCDRSLQELDDTVASVTKMRGSCAFFDNGERSPTSVSYVSTSKDPNLEEMAIRHLARSIDLRRVESASGKSTLSRSSRGSRLSKTSRVSRRKRGGNLERMISQVITCAASVSSELSYSTKDCNESACRSAQFILTDLFYEASKTKNESALPHPPFANGTSWSQLTAKSDLSVKPDPHGLTLPGRIIPRHRDTQTAEQEQTRTNAAHSEADKSNVKPGLRPLQCEDPYADLDILPAYSAHIDVIREAENESEISSFLALESHEQGTNFTLKRNDTMDASECAGAVAGSLDIDDSVFQYISTTVSQVSKAQEASPFQPLTATKGDHGVQQALPETSILADAWTSFGGSPFLDETTSMDFFDVVSFLPFEREKNEKSSPPALNRVINSATTAHDILPMWDTSLGSSPSSPASVFNFFSTDDDNDDEYGCAVDSRSDTLWDIPDFPSGSLFADTAELEAPFFQSL